VSGSGALRRELAGILGPDGVADASADSGCYTVNAGGTSAPTTSTSSCPSVVLTGGIVQDGGVVQEVDEAGNVIEGGSTSGAGGISTIPSSHVVQPNAVTQSTVSGLSASTYTVTGLQDGVTYTVAVAAVDGSGNVGPPSVEACDYPAPVNDFWKLYRQAGGGAGGGFCALEAPGAPVGSSVALFVVAAAAAGAVRRRRRPS